MEGLYQPLVKNDTVDRGFVDRGRGCDKAQ
jgi:hypothetical protein